MKKTFWRICHLNLVGLLFTAASTFNFVQSQCSPEAITAKYWQYRENLKHFVVTDRDPSGCVRDGIGQDPEDLCKCSKSGYSLPATSINMQANGVTSNKIEATMILKKIILIFVTLNASGKLVMCTMFLTWVPKLHTRWAGIGSVWQQSINC